MDTFPQYVTLIAFPLLR